MMDLDAVARLLRSVFPVRAAGAALELGEGGAITRDDRGIIGTLRLVVFDEDGSLRDVKEQTVVMFASADDLLRVEAYVRGWAKALARWLSDPDIELVMPHDLCFSEALADPELRSVDEFAFALLPTSERVARWQAARDRDELTWVIDHVGLSQHREALLRLYRPAIGIRVTPSSEFAPLGASRLGGLPDLPPGWAWPRTNGKPFEFVGQLDLSALHDEAQACADRTLLPERGVLYFFFEYERRERGGGRVLFFPGDVAELTRTARPEDLDAGYIHVARAVTYGLEQPSLPPVESPFYPELLGGGRDYEEILSAAITRFDPLVARARSSPLPGSADAVDPCHRVLGYADPLQHSPYLECESACSGHRPGEPLDPAFWRRAADWQLLLQVDSERDETGAYTVTYGDAGLLWFLIRPADLAARRFDAVWTEFQCH